MHKPSISIFGLGYVGLTLAVGLATRGFKVTGYDIDKEKLEYIARGEPPFYEPGLGELLQKALSEKNLALTTDPIKAVVETDVTFITVGTPENPDGSADLTYLLKALEDIGRGLLLKSSWHLIVIRSTVPPGTSRRAAKLLEKYTGKVCGRDFGLCMNPEFLREGNAVEDTLYPDRIVIGEYDKRSGDVLENLYRALHGENSPPILRTSLENAELIKYANNAFLAMKVSFINMIANLCEKIPGADVEEVAKGIGMDKRIGPYFLRAGLGWGGSCFPKDLKALLHLGRQLEVRLPLVEATIEINERQPLKAVELAEKLLGDLRGKRVAILGLAFKPGTDDMRNAVSIKIIDKLLERGAYVVAYDPKAMNNARRIFGNKIEYAENAISCVMSADCVIIATEWEEFKKLEPRDLVRHMRNPIIIDGRRVFNPKTIPENIKYVAIGLGSQTEEDP